MIALFRRRADEAPETSEDRWSGDAELPVHPLAGQCAFTQICRLEHALLVLGCEIANDGVRFPQQKAVLFLERRHESVRVHGEIGGLAVLTKRSANVDA